MPTNPSTGCPRLAAVIVGVATVAGVVIALLDYLFGFESIGPSPFAPNQTRPQTRAQAQNDSPTVFPTPTVLKVASVGGIEITETGALQTDKVEEILRLNNCGGTRDAEQISARSMIVNIQGELNIQETQEKLNAKYARASKSQKVVAAPGTWMEFVLTWTEQEWIGVVTQGNGGRATYVVRAPIAVELSSSKNLGCPLTPTPTPPLSIATNIPPTRIAQPTSVPVPTSRPSSIIFTTIPIMDP